MLYFDPLDHSGFPDDIENPSQGTQHAIPTLDRVTKSTRLSVCWPDDDKYYPGIVSSKSKNSMVEISYDDGDFEELDLSKEVFQVLPPADTSNSPTLTIDLDTDPCTDDLARWMIVRILGHKQLSHHKTEFQVKWDCNEVSRLPLSIVKRSDPTLLHDYALTAHGPWADHHRTQHRTLLSLCHTISKTTTSVYKYGYRLPRSTKDAMSIDREANNTLWANAIAKEMDKITNFRVFKESTTTLDNHTRLRCMLIFDIKLDGTHKACLVADGSDIPLYDDAYSSVIAPEHIRLAFIVATLNNLDHDMIDLENAYLHAVTKELAYFILPSDFGPLGGKILIFHKALYGMRTSRACFHEALSVVLLSMGFMPSKADPDLCYREHNDVYEYIARYVDDLMIFARNTNDIVTVLKEMFSIHVGPNNIFTGFTVLANKVLVYWHSTQQNTIETSTFGSEIVAARIASEKLIEYRCKLRMMGVPISGPSILFGDNISVVTSYSVLSSTLKKRHNALAYRKIRECVVAGIIRIYHVDGKHNIADLLAKPLPGDIFRRHRARLLVKPPI